LDLSNISESPKGAKTHGKIGACEIPLVETKKPPISQIYQDLLKKTYEGKSYCEFQTSCSTKEKAYI